MKYYSMPMHLHSSHEPSASIGAHMSRATELGMKYIWLTEHDIRMGRKKKAIPFFSFSEPSLQYKLQNGAEAGFTETEGNSGKWSFSQGVSHYELNISTENGELERLSFYSEGKLHCDPLFANIAVELDADISAFGGAFVSLEFVLSAQPPSYEQARIIYTLGKREEKLYAPSRYLEMPSKNENGKYRFELTRDASFEIGGIDNALCSVELVLGASEGSRADIIFRSFEFFRELDYEPVRLQQIKLAEELGKKWGITPFVSYEISGAEHHINVFSTRVPVINYAERNFELTLLEAVSYVKGHNAVFSYNHPFSEWNNFVLSHEDKCVIVNELAQRFFENRVFGASLIEVGFPENKGLFDEKYHLALWDKLSLLGVMISGEGDSDNHRATDAGWTRGNNFCTYVGVLDSEEPSEDSFVRAMKRGSVWFGDPSVMGEISFGSDESPQGSVTVGDSRRAEIAVSGVRSEGTLVRIVDGEKDFELPLSGGAASDSFTLLRKGTFSFVRYEIRNDKGRLLASTNPLYIAKSLFDIHECEIEDGRLVCG